MPADLPSPRGGILRAARRPAGWRAPGPAPAPPHPRAREALWPGPGEDLCWLAGDWRILQRTDGHRFSLDDLVTAHLAARLLEDRPRGPGAPPPRLLDLGCGIGTVLLLLAWRFPEAEAWGIEAQDQSAELARRSIAWNGVGARCRVLGGDLRDPAALGAAASGAFDLCTGTPPYFPRGTGLESDRPQRAPCRFEHRGGIEEYAAAAARHLGPGAPFVACAAAGQRARVAAAAAAADLALERWRDVIPRAGKPPLLSVFAMRRRAQAARLVLEPPLVVRDAAGRRTDDFSAVRIEMGMPP
jgi:tRNA1(Val) A37 N6-methylase TrmN6